MIKNIIGRLIQYSGILWTGIVYASRLGIREFIIPILLIVFGVTLEYVED